MDRPQVMPYSEYLPSVVWGMDPKYLRVKELFESIEAFRWLLHSE